MGLPRTDAEPCGGAALNAAVATRQLFRVYSTPEGDAAALQGLDLRVEQGELVVVLGPSGSGKTTLLRLIAGLDRPSAGTLAVLGLDLPKLSPRRLADFRATALGYVDQHYARALAPELSARELAGLQLGLQGAARDDRMRRADELLERVGLADRRDHRPEELSGGEQQRVAVCAALAHRPRLLLADEPTGELDAVSAERVYTLIGQIVRELGCTALIVSHDPESAAIADRVVWIRDGRVSEERRLARTEAAIVVGRGGWLRLPEELLLRAGIADRATAQLDERRIVLTAAPADARVPSPATRPRESAPTQPLADGTGAELSSLTKTFGRGPQATTVFTELTARFPASALTVVSGRSGSGKTTLLHTLAGLEPPSSGEVLVSGISLSGLDRDALARLRRAHVALVRQEPGLVPFLSARENVGLALSLRGVPAGEASIRALEALEAVGLAERAEQRVARLSAGERQRAAIARALAARPALLLADEPTARLDQANAAAVGTLLAQLARETGAAVVCATHDPLVIDDADEELKLGERAPQ